MKRFYILAGANGSGKRTDMKTMTMTSANGGEPILIDKILNEELGDKCAFYARVTIPAGSIRSSIWRSL